MRRLKTGSVLAVTLLCLMAVAACKEPTKPIKKLNIKRASDFEPIQPPPTQSTTTTAAEPDTAPPPPSEAIEIVEVPGFSGDCDHSFAGINEEGLVTMRNASQVRTYRLAGIAIPDEMKLEAQNQIRIWLDKKSVGVEVDDAVPAIDSAVYLYSCPEGLMVNEELVRAGLAVPSKVKYRRTDALKKASVEALTAGRGVWGRKSK